MGETKVIVVEDHDIFRSYLKAFVQQVDHCRIVAEAVDGEAALEAIRKIPADLIVLDLRLPRMSGLSVIQESKKISIAKILVMTMHTEMEIIQQALDAGADGICLKDKDIKVFEKAIMETLEGKRPVYVA